MSSSSRACARVAKCESLPDIKITIMKPLVATKVSTEAVNQRRTTVAKRKGIDREEARPARGVCQWNLLKQQRMQTSPGHPVLHLTGKRQTIVQELQLDLHQVPLSLILAGLTGSVQQQCQKPCFQIMKIWQACDLNRFYAHGSDSGWLRWWTELKKENNFQKIILCVRGRFTTQLGYLTGPPALTNAEYSFPIGL